MPVTVATRLTDSFAGRSAKWFLRKILAFADSYVRPEAWFSHEAQLQEAIEQSEVDLVVDVGANLGQFSSKVRRYYRGEIISLEPVSSTFEQLVQTSSADPLWRACKVAAGSSDDWQQINVSGRSDFSSLRLPTRYSEYRFGSDAMTSDTERVRVRRLDALLPELVPDIRSRRIFLKLDTQGYDLEAFRGIQGLLPQLVVMQSEISLIHLYRDAPHWTSSIREYEEAGFGVYGMFPVTRDRSTGQVIEYDCLMTRQSGIQVA